MQVQDFTVIRISPIVYNDRDILEIAVILKGPKLGTQTHTILQRHAFSCKHTHTHCSHTQNKESPSVLNTVQSGWAILQWHSPKIIRGCNIDLLFGGSVCWISHKASRNVSCGLVLAVHVSLDTFFSNSKKSFNLTSYVPTRVDQIYYLIILDRKHSW